MWIWKARHGAVQTKVFLNTRGIPVLDSCPRCSREPEDLNHLLCGCAKSMDVWHATLRRLELQTDVHHIERSENKVGTYQWKRRVAKW